MKVTRKVIEDLLPAYLGGEASADTVALVEEYLRGDPELAGKVEASRDVPLPEPIGPRPTLEKETLDRTRRLLRWRGVLMGVGIFLTLLPLSFAHIDGRVRWIFLQDAPAGVTVLAGLGAAISWAGFFYVRRRLQGTGL
jgi:hypothetical protein